MFSLNRLMGMPDNASEHGYTIDHMLEFCHWFMLALAVGWSIFFVYTLWRFRAGKSPKADYYGVRTKASTHIEFMVVLIDVLLLLGFAVPMWAKRVNNFPLGDAITVKVVGQQFAWNFHYPGPDGVFGRQDANLISSSNQLGLDPTDPHSQDDIVSLNEMHVPVNHNVILIITSKDVIHSVSIESMRIGQDAIPGSEIPIWFKPVKVGTYEIICAQLCGSGHSAMRGVLVVDSEADYKSWLDDMEKLNAPPPAAAAPAAAAPAAQPAPVAGGEK
jgi:cytochrome c oxidase subunit 2